MERGGDVTFHGRGSWWAIPFSTCGDTGRTCTGISGRLEDVLIQALGRLGIEADRNPGCTGVWTAGRKIASIGIHVKQWVTLHGFALNVTHRSRSVRPHRALRDPAGRDDERGGGAAAARETRR